MFFVLTFSKPMNFSLSIGALSGIFRYLELFNNWMIMENLRKSSEMTELSRESTRLVDDEEDRDEVADSDSQMTKSSPTEWTDEKHNLYLKSMEASFVNQLYNSMGILGFQSCKEESSEPRKSSHSRLGPRNSSSQFKILRGGCWQKMNFDKAESQTNGTDESRPLSTNPWIQHYRPIDRQHPVMSSFPQEIAEVPEQEIKLRRKKTQSSGLPSSSEQLLMHQTICRQNSVANDAEVSDQNFISDYADRGKANNPCSPTRTRSLPATTPSNDQVVPFGKFPQVADTNKSDQSLKR